MSDEFPDLLDLLVDGPSHVAGLYRSYVKHVEAVSVGDLAEMLRQLEAARLIRLWLQEAGKPVPASALERDRALSAYEAELDGADLDSFYHDEIGLWCDITGLGRERWKEAGLKVELDGARWTLDEQRSTNTLTIMAETEHAAERVLNWWLDRHGQRGPASEITIHVVPHFELRGGEHVQGGVKLTCRVETDPVP